MFTVHSFEVLLPRWLYKTYCPERELFEFGISAVLLSSCQCSERIKHTQTHTCANVSSIMIRGTNRTQSQTQSGSLHHCSLSQPTLQRKAEQRLKEREEGQERWNGNVLWRRENGNKIQISLFNFFISKWWQRFAQRQILKCLAHKRGTQFSQILQDRDVMHLFYFEGVAVEVLVNSPQAKITHD